MRDHSKCSTSEVELHTCDLTIIREIFVMFLKGETLNDVTSIARPTFIEQAHSTLDKVKESLSDNEGFVSVVARRLDKLKNKDEWAEFIG